MQALLTEGMIFTVGVVLLCLPYQDLGQPQGDCPYKLHTQIQQRHRQDHDQAPTWHHRLLISAKREECNA